MPYRSAGVIATAALLAACSEPPTGPETSTGTDSDRPFQTPITVQGTDPLLARKHLDCPNRCGFQLPINGLALGLNEMADITGFELGTSATPIFVWRHGRPMQTRSSFRPDGAATQFDRAFDLNNYGQVVGRTQDEEPGICRTPGCIPDRGRAALWEPDGKVLEIGVFDGVNSTATAVNDWPVVVGFAANGSGPGRGVEAANAFYWTWKEGLKNLGTLGGVQSAAYDINNKLEVVGSSTVKVGEFISSSDPRHAFIWTESRGMRDLGVPAGHQQSFAMAINENSWVAGYAENAGKRKAVVWKPDGAMLVLPTADDVSAWATDINHWGEVVGVAQMPDLTSRVFVWHEATGVVFLDAMGRERAWTEPLAHANEGNPRINSWGDVTAVLTGPGTANPRSYVWVWAENRDRYGF